jgi:hypothetical protein
MQTVLPHKNSTGRYTLRTRPHRMSHEAQFVFTNRRQKIQKYLYRQECLPPPTAHKLREYLHSLGFPPAPLFGYFVPFSCVLHLSSFTFTSQQ